MVLMALNALNFMKPRKVDNLFKKVKIIIGCKQVLNALNSRLIAPAELAVLQTLSVKLSYLLSTLYIINNFALDNKTNAKWQSLACWRRRHK